MSTLTPEFRKQRARMGAYAQHAKHDTHATTQAARDGFQARFLRQVDPDGILSEVERNRRARAAMRSHMIGMALRSAAKRKLPVPGWPPVEERVS